MKIDKREAENLLQNEVFQKVMSEARAQALETLVSTDPENMQSIIREQVKVSLIDNLHWLLGVALNEPDEAEDSPE